MTLLRCTGLVLALSVLVMAGCSEGDDATGEIDVPAADMDSLVSAEWLALHMDDPDVVILDATVVVESDGEGGFRSVSGRSAYDDGHIPTAGFADLFGDLTDQDSPLQFAVPAPEAFAAAMESLGVGDDTKVVIYDATGSMWAARVWWMLRWIGFDNAALLDGGLDAWTASGGTLSTDPASRAPGKLTVNLRPELIADRAEVLAAVDDDSVGLVDALPPAHYRGEMVMYDRPGHIPGARNVPVFSLVGEDGRFKSADELQSVFGEDRDARAIHYCGGGIAASATAFMMTRLGYKDVAVYTASLQEWAADPSNPMATAVDSE